MQIEYLGEGDPEVAVVGAIHGDEPCGARAVQRLVEASPSVDRPVALILANEEALAAETRYVDADLNRSFPGSRDADTHEGRLAARLADEIAGCETLALHSTQSYGGLFGLVDEIDAFAERICPRLALDAVVETGTDYDGRIFSAVDRAIEVECGYQGSERAAENALAVSRAFLSATGAVPHAADVPAEAVPLYRLGGPIPKEAADAHEVYAENFEEVAAGEVFAATEGEDIVAEESFHPVLLSPYGYDDVFGYRATRVGSLGGDGA